MLRKYFVLLFIISSAFFWQTLKAQQYIFDKKISVPGNGGYDYMAIDEVFNYRINLNATYQLTSTFVLEFFGNFNSARNEIQGRYPSFTSYNFAARKQLWNKKASIAFTTTNPFRLYVNQATQVTGSDFTLNSLRRVPYRSFGLNFTWKFGKLEFKKDKDDIPVNSINFSCYITYTSDMKQSFRQYTSLVAIILFFGCSFHSMAQSQPLTATDVRNGVFVYFSYRDGSKSTYTRNGEIQKEVNPVTRENTLWDIQWINDSTYSMQYNSGLEDHPKEELNLLKKHKFVIQILALTDNYYIFRSSLDKSSNPAILTDTLWIKQRRDAKNKVKGNNPGIDSILLSRRDAFDSAASKTATLYVFRPGKFVESMQNCILTINDTPAVVISNKSTFIIRFVKEGTTRISAKINKQESVVMLDIKKGNKYFLRCEIRWNLPPKPILTLVNEEEGKTYFDNIK